MIVSLLTLLAVLLVPVAGASASDASIKAAIRTYSPKILVAEGHVLSTLGEYKSTSNPAPVEAALSSSIDVLRGLKGKIARQPAFSPRVKLGKLKLEKGLQAVIVAYEHLTTAFNEKAASPQAATEEAEKAGIAVKEGRLQLAEGLKLLKQ